MKTFNRDSVFRISKPNIFAHEICKAITGTTGDILFGNCEYVAEKDLRQRLGLISVQFDNQDGKSENLLQAPLFGNKLLFLKFLRFQPHSEYRFLFPTNGQVISSIEIDCPNAIDCCETITQEELRDVTIELSKF